MLRSPLTSPNFPCSFRSLCLWCSKTQNLEFLFIVYDQKQFTHFSRSSLRITSSMKPFLMLLFRLFFSYFSTPLHSEHTVVISFAVIANTYLCSPPDSNHDKNLVISACLQLLLILNFLLPCFQIT